MVVTWTNKAIRFLTLILTNDLQEQGITYCICKGNLIAHTGVHGLHDRIVGSLSQCDYEQYDCGLRVYPFHNSQKHLLVKNWWLKTKYSL